MFGKAIGGKLEGQARRGLAVVNYMAQDGPDLVLAPRVLPQRMASPTEGDIVITSPRGPSDTSDPIPEACRGFLKGRSRSRYDDRSAAIGLDVTPRMKCSNGYIQRNGGSICHWSKTQSTVALSSGDAELDSVFQGILQGIEVIIA